ncbi:MAG: hypothetical protein WBX29_10465 [Nitrososphaeraceae archaeon]
MISPVSVIIAVTVARVATVSPIVPVIAATVARVVIVIIVSKWLVGELRWYKIISENGKREHG